MSRLIGPRSFPCCGHRPRRLGALPAIKKCPVCHATYNVTTVPSVGGEQITGLPIEKIVWERCEVAA